MSTDFLAGGITFSLIIAGITLLVCGVWWWRERPKKPKRPAPRRKAARRTPKTWVDERRVRRERLREALTDDTVEQEPIRRAEGQPAYRSYAEQLADSKPVIVDALGFPHDTVEQEPVR